MNLAHADQWLAAAARWWLQSTHFASALPGIDDAPVRSPAPVRVDAAAANPRELHEQRVRPDVPLMQ